MSIVLNNNSNTGTTTGLVLCLDSTRSSSYPGTGTTWTDLSSSGVNGSLASTTYVNNALVFNGSSSNVSLPGQNTRTSPLNLSSNFSIEFTFMPLGYQPTLYYGLTNQLLVKGNFSTLNYCIQVQTDTSLSFIKRTTVTSGVNSYTIVTGGTNYTAGDTFTVGYSTVFTVVSAPGGVVQTVSITNVGSFPFPSAPIPLTTQTPTLLTSTNPLASGVTLTVTYVPTSSESLQYHTFTVPSMLGKVTHAIFSVSSSDITLYVNNTLIGTTAIQGLPIAASTNSADLLAMSYNDNNMRFIGNIYACKIYNIQLSASQRLQNYLYYKSVLGI